jgi:hypothetical protein
MPVLQLDRIYMRGFTVEAAKVLHGASWARLSDHAPIIADLRLLNSADAIELPADDVAENSHASN